MKKITNKEFLNLENLANRFNLGVTDLDNLFENNGLKFNLFLDEIKIEFLWQNLIYQIYAKKIDLDEKEVTNELNKMISEQKSIVEYNLSEIETNILKENELQDLQRIYKKFLILKQLHKNTVTHPHL